MYYMNIRGHDVSIQDVYDEYKIDSLLKRRKIVDHIFFISQFMEKLIVQKYYNNLNTSVQNQV